MNKYEKWEKSIEGICYNLGVIGEVTYEDTEHKLIIAKTLQKLPKKIREKVLDDVLFVFTSCYGTVRELYFPIPPKTKEIRKSLIILNFALMKNEKRTESDMMDTVAHEIAHFILGHVILHDDFLCERKADDLSESWGFKRAYDSYEHIEKWVGDKK